MATTDANGFVTIANADVFNISHFNDNAAAASAVANRVTTAEGNITTIQTALGTKVDTSTYTAGMATKVNSSTYTSGMATKVDKVEGKGLSTEDYTTAEKTKLANLAKTIASPIVKVCEEYNEIPASSYTINAIVKFLTPGTQSDPAVCYISVYFKYNDNRDITTSSPLLEFYFNGFRLSTNNAPSISKPVFNASLGDELCGTVTWEIDDGGMVEYVPKATAKKIYFDFVALAYQV